MSDNLHITTHEFRTGLEPRTPDWKFDALTTHPAIPGSMVGSQFPSENCNIPVFTELEQSHTVVEIAEDALTNMSKTIASWYILVCFFETYFD